MTAGLAAAPLWPTYLSARLPIVTLGRLVLILVAFSIFLHLVSRREAEFPRAACVMAFGGVATALGALIAQNAQARGCFCAGAFPGYLELMGAIVLVGVLVARDPTRAACLVVAAAAGSASAAIVAIAGVDDLHWSLVSQTATIGDRLAGPYLNPNLLGFLLACGLPGFLAADRSTIGRQLIVSAAAALTTAALILTVSRGSYLAAGAGAAFAFVTTGRSKAQARKRALALGAASLLLLAPAYLLLRDVRGQIDFKDEPTGEVDRTGWDTNAVGPIPQQGGRLTSRSAPELVLHSNEPGQGASFPLGPVKQGDVLSTRFTAAASNGYLAINYAIQDNRQERSRAVKFSGAVSNDRSRRFKVQWRAPANFNRVRFYVWTEGRGNLRLRRLRYERTGGQAATALLPVRLKGSTRSRRTATQLEDDFVQSRLEASQTAVDALWSSPVEGVGWQRFTAYANTTLGYAIATHNAYLEFGAELGFGGILLLGVLVGLVTFAWRRQPADRIRLASGAILVAGAVNLLFVNALVIPELALPLAVAGGVSLGRAGTSRGQEMNRIAVGG